jgi:hypothetical protein
MSVRVSIVATPDAMVSPISGLFELLGYAGTMAVREGEGEAGTAPFDVEIVGASPGPVRSASGLPIAVHRAIEEVAATDVVIVPSMQMHHDGDWMPGRYPRVLAWIRAMYAGGATVCSPARAGCSPRRRACSTATRRPSTGFQRRRSAAAIRGCGCARTARSSSRTTAGWSPPAPRRRGTTSRCT